MITINQRLLAIREALGMTQRDFCRSIYVSQSFYANLECGTRVINDRIIALVCSQFGVSKEYFKDGIGEMFSDKLPELQLEQLLEIFNQLNPYFRDYILLQVKQLFDVQKRQEAGTKNQVPKN